MAQTENPLTRTQIRFAVARVVQRKKEKNQIKIKDFRPPPFTESAAFKEIQAELEDSTGKEVPELLLEKALLEMVRSEILVPLRGEFYLRSQVKNQVERLPR